MAGGSGAQDLRWNFRATIFFKKQKKEVRVNTAYDAGNSLFISESGGARNSHRGLAAACRFKSG